MELDAEDRSLPMGDGHDGAVGAFGVDAEKVRQRLACAGVPGPGEITIARGRSSSNDCGSNASLRITRSRSPASRSICCTRL
jgi:hypothetical protein